MNTKDLWKKIAVILLAVLLIYAFTDPPWAEEMQDPVTTEDVAVGVFDDFGLTFVILGLLLAAALIGGIFMAKMPREMSRHMRRGKVVEIRLKNRPRQNKRGGGY